MDLDLQSHLLGGSEALVLTLIRPSTRWLPSKTANCDWQEALERGLVVPASGATNAELEDVFGKLYLQ
jgi:hypothetical protein